MRTKEHLQKLYETFKEEGILKATKYDFKRTSNRGYVKGFAKAVGAGLTMGLIANTLYSGVESLVTEKTFVDTFQYLESVSKGNFIGGAIGSQTYCSLNKFL